MTTPPTADSPTPRRHRKPVRADHDASGPLRKLTPREAQTLAHLAAGRDLPDTAAALGITPTTARSYLLRAMRKLGAPTEAEAIALAGGTVPPVPPVLPVPPVPPVRPLVPPNFAGTTPSALGPASNNGQPLGGTPTTGHDGRRDDGTSAPAASPGARRDRSARKAHQERGTQAHTPPPEPHQAPPRHTARTATTDPPASGAPGGTARSASTPAAPDNPQPAAADRTAGSDSRRAQAAPASAEGRGAAPAAPTADGHDRPSPADAAERGDAVRDAEDSTVAKAPQHPAAGQARRAGTGAARDSVASGEQHPAGTEGHGDTAHSAPAAPAAAPPPSPLPADRPVPSFEELYESVHTRLVQQVFLLTACRHRAVHCARRAFGEARRRWPAVLGSGDPEGWVRVRACELALSPWHRGGPRRAHAWGLPHRRIKVRPADESQAVLPDHDRLTDRDRALLKALKRLSRPQRRALVLHDGLGLPAEAIALEVESTLAAAEGRVWTARAALAQWVPDLVGPDPAAPGFADGLSRLLHRAAVRGCPEPHRSPVPVLRARHRLWTASRTGAAALLTVAVGGATLATLAGVRPAVLFRPSISPTPSLCLPVAEAEPGVPLLPGGTPNGINSIWCSPAPGLEAVLVRPHTQAAARWELPAAARGADAPPPQGPAVCPLLSPRPCTTGPKAR